HDCLRPTRTATGPPQALPEGSPTRCGPTARGKKSPHVLKVLEELLQDATAGDPLSGLKWTHRSLRKIQEALRRRGFRPTPPSVARLLRRLHFSLRTNRKRLAGIRDLDRDRQF